MNKRKKRTKERNQALVVSRYNNSKHIIKERKKSEMSSGELKIAEVLKNNGVVFIREYFKAHLYNLKTQHLLFFDFFLPDYNAVIEFDGPHHHKPVYGEEALISQKYKDKRKNRYCEKRNMPILRIPYWQGNNIEVIICKWFDKHF